MIIRVVVISVAVIALGLMGFTKGTQPEVASELPVLINPYLIRDGLPDLSSQTDIQLKKTMFFSALLPLVQAENEHTLSLRASLLDLKMALKDDNTILDNESLWLEHLARRYRINACLDNEVLCIDKLLSRVDIISPSLVPEAREGEAIHEVKSFDWIHHSVRAYMMNLNTHRSYKKLREIRAAKRKAGVSILGEDLAHGLVSYSQRGLAYVEEIVNMIHFNEMEKYDS